MSSIIRGLCSKFDVLYKRWNGVYENGCADYSTNFTAQTSTGLAGRFHNRCLRLTIRRRNTSVPQTSTFSPSVSILRVIVFQGGFRFTTEQARNDYTHFALTYMRPIQPLVALSEKLARRMTALAGGRAWLSAHMRRGDFTIVGWVKDRSLEAHLQHIKDVFEEGKKRKLVKQVLRGGMPRSTDP